MVAKERKILVQTLKRLFETVEVPYLDRKLLLDVKPEDEIKPDWPYILSETFIKDTKIFQ